MKELRTATGEPFRYKGSLDEELIVYPSDRIGEPQDRVVVAISPFAIRLVMGLIEKHGRLLMGACRDKPPLGSLGHFLKQEKQTPQILSYLIPALAKEGFCRIGREGRAITVEHVAERETKGS